MEREQTTIRLPAGLKEKLEREAQEMKITLNDMIRSYLIINEEINEVLKLPKETKKQGYALNPDDLPGHSFFIGDFRDFSNYINRRRD